MKLALIGDYDNKFRPHLATDEAIEHVRVSISTKIIADWIPTDNIDKHFERICSTYDAFWIAPGSPYRNTNGVLRIIQFARENMIPCLGTCGGFQHIILEFAKNVLKIDDAEHAEHDPYASNLIVTPLSCNLKGKELKIEISNTKSLVYRSYLNQHISEKYYCNFGLNPAYEIQLQKHGLQIVGSDDTKEARIVELINHPFFVGTLFVPQDNSSYEQPHKLIHSFLQAAKIQTDE